MSSVNEGLRVEAIILPKVTSDLPLCPIPFSRDCHHLSGISLADPGFGSPGAVDVLLGVDVFSDVLLHGRQFGSPGTPSAFETRFGWVLAGAIGSVQVPSPTIPLFSQLTTCFEDSGRLKSLVIEVPSHQQRRSQLWTTSTRLTVEMKLDAS